MQTYIYSNKSAGLILSQFSVIHKIYDYIQGQNKFISHLRDMEAMNVPQCRHSYGENSYSYKKGKKPIE